MNQYQILKNRFDPTLYRLINGLTGEICAVGDREYIFKLAKRLNGGDPNALK